MPDWKELLNQPRKPAVITQNLVTARAKELLYEVDKATGVSNLTRIATAWIEKCAEGDVQAIRELLDRTEGRVPQVNENHNRTYRELDELSDADLLGRIAGLASALSDAGIRVTLGRAEAPAGAKSTGSLPPVH